VEINKPIMLRLAYLIAAVHANDVITYIIVKLLWH